MEGTEIGKSLGFQPLGVILPAGFVDDLPGLLIAAEAPGDGGHRELLVDDRQGAGGVGCHVYAAHGNHLNTLGCVAASQLVVGEHRHGDVAAGTLLHQIGEVVCHPAVHLGIRAVDRHGQLDGLVLVFRPSGLSGALGAAAQCQQKNQYQRDCLCCSLHSCLLCFLFCPLSDIMIYDILRVVNTRFLNSRSFCFFDKFGKAVLAKATTKNCDF